MSNEMILLFALIVIAIITIVLVYRYLNGEKLATARIEKYQDLKETTRIIYNEFVNRAVVMRIPTTLTNHSSYTFVYKGHRFSGLCAFLKVLRTEGLLSEHDVLKMKAFMILNRPDHVIDYTHVYSFWFPTPSESKTECVDMRIQFLHKLLDICEEKLKNI